jgi:SAM-dependent methyltransferase
MVPDTTYYDGSVFPFPDYTFDHLYLTEVLEHIYDLVPFLSECRRVLRPGGSLFLSVPFQARYHYIPHDYWRFTPAALERLLSDVGFQHIEIRPRGTDISVACYKILCVLYRWLLGRASTKLLGLLMAPVGGAALAIGHLSLKTGLGSQDDTLGYIVVASKC